MDRFSAFWLPLLLLSSGVLVDAKNDSSIDEHRVPRVSGRIVKIYSGNRPEPYLCNSEGYKADPHSCASFYRCVKERNGKFNVFRYQCAPGTVYDPDLETCNHPRSTRRTKCGGMVPTVTTDSTLVNDIEIKKELPRPINTNKLGFHQSTDKEKVTKAETTWFTSSATKRPLETTVFLYPITLAAYADTTKQNQGFNFVEPEITSWTSNKQDFNWDKTTSQPKVSNSKNDDICSDDGFTGDTDNCRKFYRCIGNQRGGFLRYEFFCSESTIWDEQIQSCNHPWAVKRSKCGRSLPLVSKFISTEPSKTTTVSTATETTPISISTTSGFGQKTKTIQQQLQISHGSIVTQTQTQISHSDQVIQNQTQINNGDRKTHSNVSETKQNQTQIAHGSAVSQTQTQINYGTKGMQTQLQIDHSKDSSQSQTQIQESTTTQSTTSNQNGQCSASGFMGDSNDCKKFYRCVDNGRGRFTKYEYKCGEGTVWDQSIEACNHAWAVKECGGPGHSESQPSSTVQSTTYREQTTTTQRTSQSTTEISETDIDDIDVGYGNQEETTTTTKSTTIKPQYETTKDPQYQTTKASQNESNNNNECKSSGFMGDANNCKKFYRCVDNGMGGYTRHEFTCGEGTVWDTSIEACNHAWAVKSCGESESSTQGSQTSESTTSVVNEETTTTTSRPGDKNTEGTDEPIRSTTTESPMSSTTNTVPITDNKCKQSGFIGDNHNCKKFYRCVDNGDGTYTRHEFTCGEGTVWDSKIEACNHEWAVEPCSGNGVSHSTTSKQPILQDEDKDESTTENNVSSSTTQHTTSSSTTTDKNEIIAPDQECTSGGFMGDKHNCKKFYRCVENNNGGYDRYQFSCGEGTVWDASISACNHAWAVKTCSVTGSDTSQSNIENTSEATSSTETDNFRPTQQTTEQSTSTARNPTENEVVEGDCENEGFYGSSTDCKKFIRCVDNGIGGFTKYEFTCGEGTTWNQNIAACDHPSPDRPCGQNNQSTAKPSQVNDEMVTETTSNTELSTSSPDKEEFQQTQKPQQTSPSKCESEGFYGDPSNCKKFYRCVDDGKGGYTKFDFTCGEGTVWNQEIVACDHESDDKSCLSSVLPTEESSSQSHSTTSNFPLESTTASSTSSGIQGTEKTESPSSNNKCTSEGFFPHSHDCKKFVRCVNNGNGGYTRYEFSCGQGTVWVQEIQTCDHDNGQSTCAQQTETTKKPQNSGTSSSTTETSTNAENQTENKQDDEYPDQTTKQPLNAESNRCTSEGYFENKNDCRKFYRCVDNGDGSYKKYDFDCGEGTAWDSTIETCNHINEVKSCSENNKDESQTQETMKDEESSQTTEGSSSTTKETTLSSDSNEESGSGSNTGSEDKCKSEGYYGDSKDCKKFYRCVDNGKGGLSKYDFTCGEGTIWDQDITNCNHPQDVNNPSCGSSGGDGGDGQSLSTGSTSTTSSPETTSSSSTSDNSTQSSSNCSQQESSKKPDSSKHINCNKAGYYPNPNDCKKFYRCVDWDGDGKRFSVYHFDCGEGTIWDPALDTCNHEESVYPPRDCSQTQSQSETSEETTQKQEETTTEESTSSDKTTTQESTTSEQTTTAQDKTTTQKTTTQQSTTSKQTTTQQSTTSEKTTTQESTTSEQTTTQQSTTSEKTTTQESTSEQTTTQQSTTSEQTTTQESTTSEQTTQESTTGEQTTQESTEQTDSSITDGTTESSTTEAENGSTTEQSSTTEGEKESTTESSPSSDKECPETEDDQYLLVCPTSFKRHPKYCNMFYQCKEDDDTHEVNIATFKCPNETIYDESQTKCVEEKEADKKCDGEMARRHRFKRLHRDSKEPITVDKESKSCPKEGYYAFEKSVECSNGFLKCEKSKSGKIRGYVHQCPEGFLFWTISKRCELGRNIRDCKRSSNDWTGRWNIPIDRKNIAF